MIVKIVPLEFVFSVAIKCSRVHGCKTGDNTDACCTHLDYPCLWCLCVTLRDVCLTLCLLKGSKDSSRNEIFQLFSHCGEITLISVRFTIKNISYVSLSTFLCDNRCQNLPSKHFWTSQPHNALLSITE